MFELFRTLDEGVARRSCGTVERSAQEIELDAIMQQGPVDGFPPPNLPTRAPGVTVG
jgi:hypothetical protein